MNSAFTCLNWFFCLCAKTKKQTISLFFLIVHHKFLCLHFRSSSPNLRNKHLFVFVHARCCHRTLAPHCRGLFLFERTIVMTLDKQLIVSWRTHPIIYYYYFSQQEWDRTDESINGIYRSMLFRHLQFQFQSRERETRPLQSHLRFAARLHILWEKCDR